MSRSRLLTSGIVANLALCWPAIALAAGEVALLDVRSMACGMLPTQVGDAFPPWHLFGATLASESGWRAEAAYLRLYGLPQLGVRQVSLAKGFGGIGLGLGLSSFGWVAYRETVGQLVVAAGRERISFGAAVLGVRSEYRRYGVRAHYALLLSSEVRPSRSVSVRAMTGDLLPHDEAPFGRNATISLTWKWANLLAMSMGMSKEPGLPLEVRAGICYMPARVLVLRAGLTQAPQRLTAGCTFRLAGISVSYAYVDHADLGATHAVAVAFERRR